MGLQFHSTPIPSIAVGQRWRHKRDRWRRVEITAVDEYHGQRYLYADVKRNTSRRRQPIRLDTLRRNYELIVTD